MSPMRMARRVMKAFRWMPADSEVDPFMYLDRGNVVAPADTWDNTDVWAAKHSRKAVGQ